MKTDITKAFKLAKKVLGWVCIGLAASAAGASAEGNSANSHQAGHSDHTFNMKNPWGMPGTILRDNITILSTGDSHIDNYAVFSSNSTYAGTIKVGYGCLLDTDLNLSHGLNIGDAAVVVSSKHFKPQGRTIPVGTGEGASDRILVAYPDGNLRELTTWYDKTNAMETLMKNLQATKDSSVKPEKGENRIYGNTTLGPGTFLVGDNFADDAFVYNSMMQDSIATPGSVVLNSRLWGNSDAGDYSKLYGVTLFNSAVGMNTLVVPYFKAEGEVRLGSTREQNAVCMSIEPGGTVDNDNVYVLTDKRDTKKARDLFAVAVAEAVIETARPSPGQVAKFIGVNLSQGPSWK